MTEEILREIKKRAMGGKPFTAAIDGRCAAGKTSLASELAEKLGCPVLHMDDFFLRPMQRTPERLAEPGGNVDRERFLKEVLEPLGRGETFSYRPYDCASQSLGDPVTVTPGAVNIVEGSYSCHPELWGDYGLRVFLSVSPEEQMRRIEARNGAMAGRFKTLWIPMEERYFAAFNIAERCDMRFET